MFKRAPHLPFAKTAVQELSNNAFVFRIQPDEGITVRFGSKVPNTTSVQVRDVTMDFQYGESFVDSSPEAYERLILDVLLGDPPLFPRHEEVELGWEILDPVLDHWAEARQARAVRVRRLGARIVLRHDRARRTHLEAAMIRLDDTSGGAVAAAIAAERHRMGSAATGMVLSLLILTDEEYQADATAAAVAAARQHPMRIVTLIPRPGPARAAPRRRHRGRRRRRTGRGGGAAAAGPARRPCELGGHPAAAHGHAGRGLLARRGPRGPAEDPIGRHAQRRITDCLDAEDVERELLMRKAGYRPGDTDLAWTRLTPWRSVLASAARPADGPVIRGLVSAEDDNPSAILLATWLKQVPAGARRAPVQRRTRHHRGAASPPPGRHRGQSHRRHHGRPLPARHARTRGWHSPAASSPSCSRRSCDVSTPTRSTARSSPRWGLCEHRRRPAPSGCRVTGRGGRRPPHHDRWSSGSPTADHAHLCLTGGGIGTAVLAAIAANPGCRLGRLAARRRLVGRRALPARRATPTATRRQPAPRCSTTCRSDPSVACIRSRARGRRTPTSRRAAAAYAADARRRRPAGGPRPRALHGHPPAGHRPGRARGVAVPRAAGAARRPVGAQRCEGRPKPPPVRVTLTLPTINAAREVWILASGADKAGAVRLALSEGAGPFQVPAAGATWTVTARCS